MHQCVRRTLVRTLLFFSLFFAFSFLTADPAKAADYFANPSNYKTQLTLLKPGDVLHLEAGTYLRLYLSGLRGTSSARITIEGPTSGGEAIIAGQSGYNTIELVNSSYLTFRRLRVDSKSLGVFGLSAKGGTTNLVHNITIENCTFVGQNTGQQDVAISTKTPTWGWIIRGNTIIGAGTGIYLGNSDGTQPFVGGIIEGNLIRDTIGYNMQIKWQLPRPSVIGMPTTAQRTLIRHNVFIKNDNPCSSDGCRPNVLIGGFPDTGAGSQDRYDVYGNFFYGNPSESQFQGSGRVTVHDNIFVKGGRAAILLRDHDLVLKLAQVYNNTVYSANQGIVIGSSPRESGLVVGNAVFATSGISASTAVVRDNIINSVANARYYVTTPSITLGQMDFFPINGSALFGAALDLSAFVDQQDYNRDFNGTSKGTRSYRGAYSGSGTNPGWRLNAERKPLPPTTAPTPSPSPTPRPSATPSATPRPSATPVASATPTATPRVSPTPVASLTPTPAPTALPSFLWVFKANEGQSFSVSGTQTVRYGEGTTWIQKTVSGTVACTNTYFGRDPLYGVVKRCEMLVLLATPSP